MLSMKTNLSKVKDALIQSDAPHYFEIENEDGKRYCHCGTMRDVEKTIAMHPTFTYEKVYLPHPPKTVDVPHISVAPDWELPMQQILPESELEPFIPNYHD